MRMLGAGDRAVSDIPMRLMIAAVLTSLAVPVFWGAYNDLSEKMTITSVEREISELLSNMDDIMSGGAGSSKQVNFEVSSFGTCRIENIVIGGDPGKSSSSLYKIQYSISGVGSSFMALDPPVMITSTSGGSLVLQEGEHSLRITNLEFENGYGVLVELL